MGKSLAELLKVESFEIAGETYDSTLSDDLEINTMALSEEFTRQAKLAAIYGFASDRAIHYEAQLKAELERVNALVDARTRGTFEATKRKFTEAMVKNTVITSVEYQAKFEEYQRAKLNAAYLKSAKEAIVHRKDMLVGLGANYRAELTVEPTIKQR